VQVFSMRVADLFSGCGGMTAGFQMAGHEVVFAAENWDRARLVYDANFQHAATRLDLSDIVAAAHAVSMECPDIIVGGPPCQDFSVAGLRAEAERANLTLGFAEIVRSVRPAWFVMENVPAAAISRAWRAAKARLRSAGYGMTEIVLDASLYGVPQLRRTIAGSSGVPASAAWLPSPESPSEPQPTRRASASAEPPARI
jgi:DNA (cytosine-5)-methyltransferase 1